MLTKGSFVEKDERLKSSHVLHAMFGTIIKLIKLYKGFLVACIYCHQNEEALVEKE